MTTDNEKSARKLHAEARKAFQLHVLLIMNRDQVNEATARALAYVEGPQSVTAMLAKPEQGDLLKGK